MNCAESGKTIKMLRTAMGLTQKQLADKMNISDKTVSKWERGLGCPDISLIAELSDILSVSIESILNGNLDSNDFKEVSMKKNLYYVCPECGNISVCTGGAEVHCCGRKLMPLEAKKADDSQALSAEMLDGEWFVTGKSPMTKDDYISFAVFATGDRMHFIKLYPEWDLQFYIPVRGHGTLLWYGEKQGLLYRYI